MALEFEGNPRYQPGRNRFMTIMIVVPCYHAPSVSARNSCAHHGNKALAHVDS